MATDSDVITSVKRRSVLVAAGVFLVLVVVVVVVAVVVSGGDDDEEVFTEATDEDWRQFKHKFGKYYRFSLVSPNAEEEK